MGRSCHHGQTEICVDVPPHPQQPRPYWLLALLAVADLPSVFTWPAVDRRPGQFFYATISSSFQLFQIIDDSQQAQNRNGVVRRM